MTPPTPLQIALDHHRAGRLREAEAIYRELLARNPDDAGVNFLLGVVSLQNERAADALPLLEKAGRLAPGKWDVLNHLSVALRESGRLDDAVDAARRAVAADPAQAEAHGNLALALQIKGDLAAAAAAYREAIRLNPQLGEAHNNLGNVLSAQRDFPGAERAYRRAIELDPKSAATYANLSSVLQELDRPDEAADACRAAIAIQPDLAQAYNNLGNALRAVGEMTEAVKCFRRAIELRPAYATAHSNYLFALHFVPSFDASAIRAEHERWTASQAEPLTTAATPTAVRDRSPDRRLRIGYVSADFREHAVGRFMLPIIGGHDRQRVEVICYSDARAADRVTEAIRSCADEFIVTASMDDAAVAARVRADGVDILVDLALHAARNRLLAFARRAAPVQATYLGYPGTSGMRAMDFRITDPHLDPPDDAEAEKAYTERSIRLPRTYWCYVPPPNIPDVARLPAAANGFVTFGCLNKFTKVSDDAVRTWATLLARTGKRSRLILHAPPGRARQRVLAMMAAENVAAERVEFVGRQGVIDYLRTYDRIDIGLDPFPYNGGTTTIDALLMGVPVVSLAGDVAVRRAGVSILTNAELPELVARTRDAYMGVATQLGADVARLAAVRSGMRARMLASPLCDLPAFVCDLEGAYRRMWQERIAS